MNKITFSDWLQQSLRFIGRAPLTWFGYSIAIGILMTLGRMSLALGVLVSITSLFVGVGVAKYIDLKYSGDNPVAFGWAVRKSLPLAILAAGSLVLFWGLFRTVAGIAAGDWDAILRFFFDWSSPQQICSGGRRASSRSGCSPMRMSR